jgi:hypothetical protein
VSDFLKSKLSIFCLSSLCFFYIVPPYTCSPSPFHSHCIIDAKIWTWKVTFACSPSPVGMGNMRSLPRRTHFWIWILCRSILIQVPAHYNIYIAIKNIDTSIFCFSITWWWFSAFSALWFLYKLQGTPPPTHTHHPHDILLVQTLLVRREKRTSRSPSEISSPTFDSPRLVQLEVAYAICHFCANEQKNPPVHKVCVFPFKRKTYSALRPLSRPSLVLERRLAALSLGLGVGAPGPQWSDSYTIAKNWNGDMS